MDTDERIEMIMRQTDYDKIVAEQKLEQHKNNVMDVIREYLTDGKPINTNLQTNNLSKNQQIYKEIRTFMDDAAREYEKNKENAKNALKEAKERKKKEIVRLRAKEKNGPKGLEPTRYGDWERKGITYDF